MSATGAAILRRRTIRRAKTSGTPVQIDPVTGVANHGSVSVLAPKRPMEAGQDHRGRPASQRHDRQPRPASSSTSPTPTAIRYRSSTRRPTRWSRRSPAGPSPAALRQRLQRPGAEPRRRHALRRQRHQQLRRRRALGEGVAAAANGSAAAEQVWLRPDPDRLVSRRGRWSRRTARSCSSPTSRASAR